MNDKITAVSNSSLSPNVNDLPTVSVIILNYNGRQHLKSCLASLANLNWPQDKLETIIVDNASADDSVAWLKQHYPEVKLLANPANLGFAAGINGGVALASGTHLAFLNPDMRVDKNWLTALWQTMTSEADIACAGSIVLNWTGDKIDYAGRPQDALNLFPNPPEDSATVLLSNADVPLLFASGGAMLISRAAFAEVGGFDKDYFLYHEDVDLGWRLWIHGHRILRSTRSIVFHKGGASSKQMPLAEMLYFVQKYILYTILKNAEDDQLWRLLSSVLWFLVDRELWWPPAKASLEPAIRELIREAESINRKREAIQSKRKSSDTQVFQVCGHPLAVLLANSDCQSFERYLTHADGNVNLPVSADGIAQFLTRIPYLVQSFSDQKSTEALQAMRLPNEAQPIEFTPDERQAQPPSQLQHELNQVQARRWMLTNMYAYWRKRERAQSIWRRMMPARIRQSVHDHLYPRRDSLSLLPPSPVTSVHLTSSSGTIKSSAIPAASSFGGLTYQCNVCGATCRTKVVELGRETSSCPNCGSTVRMRSIVHLLSTELFGQSWTLPDFPVRPDIRGIGLSDWIGYADPLPHKLNYTNTFYHRRPTLDIVAPIDPMLEASLDFLISSDVFEHVSPPVSRAFDSAYKLLKPNGLLLLTVPYTKEGQTREHFPELYIFETVNTGEKYILKNITQDGREQIFENLIFHGGDGATLEMRLFSESSLKHELTRAGFQDIHVAIEPKFEYGIYWNPDWSLGSFPITARKR